MRYEMMSYYLVNSNIDEKIKQYIINGHIELFKNLINNVSDINKKDISGFTLLHHAAYKGDTEVIEILLKKGARINILDINKCSPIYYSIRNNNREAVILLLSNGANIPDRISSVSDNNRYIKLSRYSDQLYKYSNSVFKFTEEFSNFIKNIAKLEEDEIIYIEKFYLNLLAKNGANKHICKFLDCFKSVLNNECNNEKFKDMINFLNILNGAFSYNGLFRSCKNPKLAITNHICRITNSNVNDTISSKILSYVTELSIENDSKLHNSLWNLSIKSSTSSRFYHENRFCIIGILDEVIRAIDKWTTKIRNDEISESNRKSFQKFLQNYNSR